MPPRKRCKWHRATFVLVLILSSSSMGKKPGSGFGGDFSAASMSGADTPGPTSGSMGGKAASAMAIGTGDSGPGNYASNFKTPNYTQYTNQNFKDFLPNYESMMEKSMSGGGGNKASGGSSYSNFSSVSSLLKGFMELQKEQLKLDKVEAETAKAKVDLAMDYDDGDYLSPEKLNKKRRKRSMMIQLEDLGIAKDKLLALLMSNTSLNDLKIIASKKYEDLLQELSKPTDVKGSAPGLVKSRPDPKWRPALRPMEKFEPPIKVKVIGPRPFKWKGKLDVPTRSRTKYVRQWGGGKYFKRDQPPPPPADPNSPPPSSFWANLGTKASTWFKNSPGGAPGASDPGLGGAWSSSGPGSSGGSPSSSWDSSSSGGGTSLPSWGGSPGSMGSGGASSWAGQGGSSTSSGSSGQGVSGGSSSSNGQQDQSGSSQPMRGTADAGANGGWSSMSLPGGGGGAYPSGPPPAQTSQQRRGIMPSYPMHGSVALSDEPPLMAPAEGKPMMMGFNNDNSKNIPDLSFSLSSLFPSKSMKGPERVKPQTKTPAMQMAESPLYQTMPLVKYSNELRPVWILPNHPKPPPGANPGPIYPTTNAIILSPSYSEYPNSLELSAISTGYETAPIRTMRKAWPFETSTSPKPMIISKEDNKVLIDPMNGVIIVKDSKVPVKLRSKREATTTESSEKTSTSKALEIGSATTSTAPPPDPNGHSHGPKNELAKSSMGSYPWKLYLRDLYQAQTDGESTDYDSDRVQVEEGESTVQTKDINSQESGGEFGNNRRRVKLEYTQKAHLPPGSTETISAGGGRAPGHHEGGGLTVKVKKPAIGEATKKDRQAETDKEERNTLNFFFTW